MFRLLRLVLGKVQHSLVTAAANISSAQSQPSPGQAHGAGDPVHACILVCVCLCVLGVLSAVHPREREVCVCVCYDAGTSTIPDSSAGPEKVQQISDWMLNIAMGPRCSSIIASLDVDRHLTRAIKVKS